LPTRFERINPDILVVDESTKFKNSTAKRFKMLKKVLERIPRRWILTGTFVPNGLMDIFGQVYILDLGSSLGGYITKYRKKFFHQMPWDEYSWLPNEDAFKEITELITPLLLRMKAEDYLDMPELMPINIPVELPEKVMDIYKGVEDEFIALVEGGEIVAANAAAAGTKCRQIANGAVYTGVDREWLWLHDAKLDALEDLVEEINPAPILLLYEFKHDKERIMVKYPDAVNISGMSAAKYRITEDKFNAGELPLVIGHAASMGHGLNLQGDCHHVVYFGIPWSFELYDQSFRRVYRQGQEHEVVFVYHIMANHTKDEDVMQVLGVKGATQEGVYEAVTKRREEMYV